ncbi:MAG: hypothetical protein IKF64_08240 [Eubacterium sp.]|nr:hypothetical protein [Eubacterium sp.]
MKKVLICFICIICVVCALAACSKDSGNKEVAKTEAGTTQEIKTDEAKITESDAINLIKSYSNEELGLSEEDAKEVSFLVKKSGMEYNKKLYVNVIATIKTAHEDTTDKDGNKVTSYTFDNKGEYLISFDGKQILAKNGDSDYRELKVKAVPTTTAVANADETAKEETTKK